jgi:hypothetical protein
MAEVGDVVEGLSGGKGKKKNAKAIYITLGLLVSAGLGYYLWRKHEENTTAASSDTTSPDTVDTTPTNSSDDGGIATGGPTTGTELGDPFQVGDPNETYGQELDDLESQITTDNTNYASLLSTLDSLGTEVSTIPGAGPNPGSAVSPGNSVPQSTNAQWIATVTAALQKDGLSADEASNAVNDYLNGSAITSGTAAQGIANQLSIIGAPVSGVKSIIVASGVKVPTTKTVASTVTSSGTTVSGTSETTAVKGPTAAQTAELQKAEAVATKDKGNATAEKNAEANVATVKKNIAA